MISVIVPAYNLEKYLPRCLESILKQTHDDVEIIVVNDGSVDSTGDIINSYANRYPDKIKAIHIPNGGVTNARLTGVKEATGEWIGFVDGDDEIEPDMYEFLLSNAIKYQADISHCGYQMVFDDGRVNYFHNTGCLVQQDRITGIKELLDGSLIEPGLCNKLFHKTLLHSLFHHNVMLKDIKINEDLLMNYYLFSYANKSVFEDKCPYHYIVRSGSASRQNLNHHKIYDPIKVKKIILEHCDEEIKKEAKCALLNTSVYTYCGLTCEKLNRKDDKKNVRTTIVEYFEAIERLSRRTSLLAKGIKYVPFFVDIMYPIYAKYLQKKKYE